MIISTTPPSARRASTLLITLITLAVLAAVSSAVWLSISTTANVSLHAASWQEAIMAAEAGADSAMASFKVALDEPQYWNQSPSNVLSDLKTGATAWSGWLDPATGSPPASNAVPTVLSLTTILRASSDTETGLQAAVTVEKLPSGVVNDPNGPWYRIRSTGVAGISGPARVGSDKRDNDLRKISLRTVRAQRPGYPVSTLTGGIGQVSRAVELLVKPFPKARGLWDRAITVGATVDITGTMTMDSYDSTDPAKSYFAPGATFGTYDLTKLHQSPNFYGSNCDIASNDIGSNVKLNHAYLWGNLSYNTGTATGTDHVQGAIKKDYFAPITGISAPAWTFSQIQSTPTAITKVNATLNGGTESAPARYKLSDLTLQGNQKLNFTDTGGAGSGKYIEIWCTKDVGLSGTAQVVIPPDFHVTFYIAGKLSLAGGSFANQTNQASALTLYGIDTGTSTSPQWDYGSTSDFVGTIYGNKVTFNISGAASFYGAVVVNVVTFGGTTGAGFHFDEALLKGNSSSGSTPRFQVASWIEDVR